MNLIEKDKLIKANFLLTNCGRPQCEKMDKSFDLAKDLKKKEMNCQEKP